MIDKLYIYHSRSATHEQIEANKLQLCEEWQGLEVELIKMPFFEKRNIIYATTISMKTRGLNLINKK
jgi:hypothetical protein